MTMRDDDSSDVPASTSEPDLDPHAKRKSEPTRQPIFEKELLDAAFADTKVREEKAMALARPYASRHESGSESE